MASEGIEQRRLAAIMFTDMVGYSALTQRSEKLALELLEEHRRVLRELFPKFDGREVETTGDGFLVEFSSSLAAARCAIEMQRALSTRNLSVSSDRQIHVRIGIHVGDVVHKDGHVLGDGVNIAARLQPLAAPGGICISVDVARQIQHNLEASVVSIGEAALKNIRLPMEIWRIVLPWEQVVPAAKRPVSIRWKPDLRVLAVGLVSTLALGVLGWLAYEQAVRHPTSGQPSTAPRSAPEQSELLKSIAILPCRNLSSDQENYYFAESLTEQLLDKLLNVGGLKVIPLSGSNYLTQDLADIGREFKVGTILKTSANKAEDQLRIHVELLEATSPHQVLWQTNFQNEFKHIFTIQDEVTRRVAEALKGRLLPAEQAQLAKRPTHNLEAYDLYLRGRAQWNRFSNTGLRQAIIFYEHAIRQDTNFALAYSGLSDCYNILSIDLEAPLVMYPKAKFSADRALALDDSLPQPHVSAGMNLLFFEINWKEAERELKQAIAIQENYADAHHYYAHYLEAKGLFREAQQQWARAGELDPTSLQIAQETGLSRYLAEDFEAALTQCTKAVKMDPTFIDAKTSLAAVYSQTGKPEVAIELAMETRKLPDGDIPTAISELGYAQARAGHRAKAQELLQELNRRRSSGVFVDPWNLAVIHAGLDERAEALDNLRQAIEEKSTVVFWLNVEPKFKPLRKDPRFKELLRRVGLDQ